MTKEDLLEMPNWPQAVMPQILANLQSLASISAEIAADKVEGPRLVKFVNDLDPIWAALVEASKTVKPQEAPPAEKEAATTQGQAESAAQGQPGATATDPFEPLPGQIFRLFTPEGEGQPTMIVFHCPQCLELLDLPITLGQTATEARKWAWDGNFELPTLAPSVVHVKCGWHGFVTKGQFVGVGGAAPAAPAITKATLVDTESRNETQPQAVTTSLRPHVKKMAGN